MEHAEGRTSWICCVIRMWNVIKEESRKFQGVDLPVAVMGKAMGVVLMVVVGAIRSFIYMCIMYH